MPVLEEEEEEEEVWAADTPVEEVDKSATSAARLATSLEIVPRVTVEEEADTEVEVEVTAEIDTVAGQAVEEPEVKPATLAGAMVICLVTARKARNATTVASRDI